MDSFISVSFFNVTKMLPSILQNDLRYLHLRFLHTQQIVFFLQSTEIYSTSLMDFQEILFSSNNKTDHK